MGRTEQDISSLEQLWAGAELRVSKGRAGGILIVGFERNLTTRRRRALLATLILFKWASTDLTS